MDDSLIISIYRGGEKEKAFREIVAKYSEKLYWYVRRQVFTHEDADDLVQEIFVKIWTALPSFRGEAQLFTWIYRIATNETLNFLRREKLRAAVSLTSIGERMEKKIDEDPYFNGDIANRLLAKALLKLPEKQRMVFTMRYYDEMPYEQIAAISGTSVGSLKASYHIAYEKIKKVLQENL